MTYSCTFRCFDDCAGEWPVTDAIYRCPENGGLLRVAHDLEALKDRTGAGWKELFESRWRSHTFPNGSGVWSKKEWVMPQIPEEHIVSFDEGGTHLFRAGLFGQQIGVPNLSVKLCGNSHTGSFKDLGMTVLVSTVKWAKAEGEKVRAVGCASTGDTSAALAAYGAAAQLPVVVLLPKGKISTAQLLQPLAHGALVLGLETDFDGCMAIIKQLAEEGILYLANSMNPLRIEGQKTVAIEIAQQRGWQVPDHIVLPSGNLGNASALYQGFKMMKDLGVTDRLPRLVVAQAEHANPMYRAYVAGKKTVDPVSALPTQATAIQIGNPVSAPRAMQALDAMNGIVEQASEDELADAAARADRTGLYTCPHTAVALAVTEKLAARGEIQPSDDVVVVSTAHGLKFTEFKLRYHENRAEAVDARNRNEPVYLEPDFGKVVDAINARVTD